MRNASLVLFAALLGCFACNTVDSSASPVDEGEATDAYTGDDAGSDAGTDPATEQSTDTGEDTGTGEGTDTGSDTAPVTSPLTAADTISGGFGHTCAIDPDGELFCWGANQLGQVGNGKKMLVKNVLIPEAVIEPGPWKAVSCGTYHTCGIKTADSSLWCFGGNGQGQIGVGDNADHPKPIRVGTDAWTTISAHNFEHTCGIKTDGTLWCWGDNTHGQLGQGTSGNADANSPQQVGDTSTWTHVTTGGAHVCAVQSDTSLWCWGANHNGRLGLGAPDSDEENPKETTPQKVGDDYVSVEAGGGVTCAIKVDGTLHCFGMNNMGQVGAGAEAIGVDQTTPQQIGTEEWRQVSGGGSHVCGLTVRGELHCWGTDAYGQLGQGTSGGVVRGEPTRVGDGLWKSMTVGGDHSCAVDEDGIPYCFGLNYKGQIGIGIANDTPVTEPTAVATSEE